MARRTAAGSDLGLQRWLSLVRLAAPLVVALGYDHAGRRTPARSSRRTPRGCPDGHSVSPRADIFICDWDGRLVRRGGGWLFCPEGHRVVEGPNVGFVCEADGRRVSQEGSWYRRPRRG
jgi:hypothetical protein